jgi:hypothetical protein
MRLKLWYVNGNDAPKLKATFQTTSYGTVVGDEGARDIMYGNGRLPPLAIVDENGDAVSPEDGDRYIEGLILRYALSNTVVPRIVPDRDVAEWATRTGTRRPSNG